MDGEAGRIRVLLGVESIGRVQVRWEAIRMCCGTGGGRVHVGQQNTGHALRGTNIHLSGGKEKNTRETEKKRSGCTVALGTDSLTMSLVLQVIVNLQGTTVDSVHYEEHMNV